MPFIGTNVFGSGPEPEKGQERKTPQKVEDLSMGADLDEIEKQKAQLAQASEQLRKKEQALEKEFGARLDAEGARRQEELKSSQRETGESIKALSREQSKNELLQKQVQSSLESIEALRKERQEALARSEALERELAVERRKAQQEDLQSHSGQQRIHTMEQELERSQKLLQERARELEKARAEPAPDSRRRIQELEQRLRIAEQEAKQRIAAPGSALKETASQRLPPPSAGEEKGRPSRTAFAEPPPSAGEEKGRPPRTAFAEPLPAGNMQKQFNEMAQVRQDPDGGFVGWSRRQSDDQALIVRVVQFILEQAVRTQASDIHLEPSDAFMRVRFRIDGMLSELLRVPAPKQFPVIARIRVMCGLDPVSYTHLTLPTILRV